MAPRHSLPLMRWTISGVYVPELGAIIYTVVTLRVGQRGGRPGPKFIGPNFSRSNSPSTK
jgi:hypothetical protein